MKERKKDTASASLEPLIHIGEHEGGELAVACWKAETFFSNGYFQEPLRPSSGRRISQISTF